MSDNFEKYGANGSMEFRMWENELQELTRKQKFNPEPAKDEEELQNLKAKIWNSLVRCIRNRSRAGKIFWISILVAILGLSIFGSSSGSNNSLADFGFAAMIIGVVAAIAVQKVWKKSINQNVDAIVDFDEQHFDGEILFKWKNGMKL